MRHIIIPMISLLIILTGCKKESFSPIPDTKDIRYTLTLLVTDASQSARSKDQLLSGVEVTIYRSDGSEVTEQTNNNGIVVFRDLAAGFVTGRLSKGGFASGTFIVENKVPRNIEIGQIQLSSIHSVAMLPTIGVLNMVVRGDLDSDAGGEETQAGIEVRLSLSEPEKNIGYKLDQ